MKATLYSIKINFSGIAGLLLVMFLLMNVAIPLSAQIAFPVVDTGQETFYNSSAAMTTPSVGAPFYGQDATYTGNAPSYTDNGDGTITDNVTGLMWVKSPDMDGDGDIDYSDKMSYYEAIAAADTFSLAGYSDWRLPSIKEMYSLILFSGIDPSGYSGTSTDGLVPFIDTNYFDFAYGDLSANERIIDAQMASTNIYVGLTMGGDTTMFGVNFADGRIKGYPTGPMPGQTVDKQYYIMYVRANTSYGINDFHDNNDSTVTDNATDLMWTKYDNRQGLTWEEALAYAENATLAGHSDWRLPNVKELQSIVDYTRSPSTSNSASIDPVFDCSSITDQGGNADYPYYWSSTTHANWSATNNGGWASYVAFGEAEGWMEEPALSGNYLLMDVHGAGAQRSDPKSGNPTDYPHGNGPQGDVVYIYNYVRLVRDANVLSSSEVMPTQPEISIYPNPTRDYVQIEISSAGLVDASVKVFNLLGEEVCSIENLQYSSITFDLSEQPSGVYFMTLEDGAIKISKKIIKR